MEKFTLAFDDKEMTMTARHAINGFFKGLVAAAIVFSFAANVFAAGNGKPADKFGWRAREVLKLVNEERAKHKRRPLRLSERCQRQADKRAKEICGRFNHKGAFSGLGYYLNMGENIAKGQKSPRAVVRAWMHSKGHRANILSPRYTDLGVGFHRGRWVQTFGGGCRVRKVRRVARRRR